MTHTDNEWGTSPSHSKPAMPSLEDLAAMIRSGELVEDLGEVFERSPRTLRDSLRGAGWDPDTGYELVEELIDIDAIVAEVADATWMSEALCAQIDAEPFFPESGGTPHLGKKLCATGCPVKDQCLEWALATDQRYGVWGGLSESERRALKAGAPVPAEVA